MNACEIILWIKFNSIQFNKMVIPVLIRDLMSFEFSLSGIVYNIISIKNVN